MKKNVILWKIIGFFKNCCTKHRIDYTHFDAIFILNPNVDMKIKNADIFEKLMKIFT